MGVLVDMAGRDFGRLRVLRRAGYSGRQAAWLCRCECGNEIVAAGYDLRSGHTKSCGCLANDVRGTFSITHGSTATAMYRRWTDIKTRCTNPASAAYKNYGGRGVTMDEEWVRSFAAFQRDVGAPPTPKHTLDRIDNDGPYAPGNVRWATRSEQNRNRRDSLNVEYQGKTQHVKKWAEGLGMDYATLQQRLRRYGWSVERAFTTPVVTHHNRRQ